MIPSDPRRPQLPRSLSLALGLLPQRLNSLAAAQALSRIFARERSEGELDFLDSRSLRRGLLRRS